MNCQRLKKRVVRVMLNDWVLHEAAGWMRDRYLTTGGYADIKPDSIIELVVKNHRRFRVI
ncbi:hypothetical protein D3C79_889130 [compost metagenome]